MDYLAFLPLLVSFVGSAAFLGRPLLGTVLIVSRADKSYIGDFVNGFIFAFIRRCRIVVGLRLSFSAISATVKPCTICISTKLTENLREVKESNKKIATQILLYAIIKLLNKYV